MTVQVIWPDGHHQTAPTWQALLNGISDMPWNSDLSDDELREVLVKRAYIWSAGDIQIDPAISAKEFIHGLEAAGMLKIIRDDKELEDLR